MSSPTRNLWCIILAICGCSRSNAIIEGLHNKMEVISRHAFERAFCRLLFLEPHPALGKVRRYVLCTRTAKGLYAKLEYKELPNDATTWMIRLYPEREQRQIVHEDKSYEA